MMKRFISIILTVFLVYISTISVMANDATDFYQKNSNCKNYSYSKGNDLENEYINIDNKELLVNGIVENTSGDAEMFMAGYRWYSPSKAPSYLKIVLLIINLLFSYYNTSLNYITKLIHRNM